LANVKASGKKWSWKMYTQHIIITADNQNGWKNKGGSWKNHWEIFSGRDISLQKCSLRGCPNSAEQAAHVFCPEVGMFEWLAPLCRSCNHPSNEDFFSLNIGTVLVNANRSETCEVM